MSESKLHNIFDNIDQKFKNIFCIIGFFIILISFLDGDHFGIKKKDEKNFIHRIVNRIYFALVTASTVGYGDMSPKTITSKFIVSCFLILLILGVLS